MAVTAMLVCQSTEHDTQNPEQGNVRLTAVTDGSEEAKQYFAFTPYADFRMGILNSAAFTQFEPGQVYKITIEKVEDGGDPEI